MQVHVHANMKNADNFDDTIGSLSKKDVVLDKKGFAVSYTNRVNWFGFRFAIGDGLEATE